MTQKRDAQQKCRELERGKAERRQGSVQTGGGGRDGIKRAEKPRMNAMVPPDTPGTLSAKAMQNP